MPRGDARQEIVDRLDDRLAHGRLDRADLDIGPRGRLLDMQHGGKEQRVVGKPRGPSSG